MNKSASYIIYMYINELINAAYQHFTSSFAANNKYKIAVITAILSSIRFNIDY